MKAAINLNQYTNGVPPEYDNKIHASVKQANSTFALLRVAIKRKDNILASFHKRQAINHMNEVNRLMNKLGKPEIFTELPEINDNTDLDTIDLSQYDRQVQDLLSEEGREEAEPEGLEPEKD